MPKEPKHGYANNIVIQNELYGYSEYFQKSIYDNKNYHDLEMHVATSHEEKQPKLSTVLKTFGVIAAIKGKQQSRNIFSRFFAWISGKTKQEDDIIRSADESLSKHNLGLSSKDYKKGGLVDLSTKIETLCDKDVLDKSDSESLDIMNTKSYPINDKIVGKPMDLSDEFVIKEDEVADLVNGDLNNSKINEVMTENEYVK